MHTNTLTKIVLMCPLMAILFVTTYAIAEPNKKETYDTIASDIVINSLPFDTGHSTRRTKLSSNEDMCILTYTYEARDEYNNLRYTNQNIIDLKTINPATIRTRYNSSFKENSVYFETTNKKPLIILNSTHSNQMKATNKYSEDGITYHYFSTFLTVYPDAAERVAKALKHLVTICDGKDE